ncbi:hypothetical protein RHMOL_Rhmol01G0055400 [Rhododendron molle]|uniref:Uncharacterized protein n=1 Tax=Rhododendron molle TaxID=49168 RepID=A0ACC0PZV1_RHOML|nr:hypothetical protein RHMOL_Rhmol01G0055400 [Rhododendron molle]
MVLAGAVFPSSIAGVPTAPFAGSKEFASAAALGTSDSTGLAIFCWNLWHYWMVMTK